MYVHVCNVNVRMYVQSHLEVIPDRIHDLMLDSHKHQRLSTYICLVPLWLISIVPHLGVNKDCQQNWFTSYVSFFMLLHREQNIHPKWKSKFDCWKKARRKAWTCYTSHNRDSKKHKWWHFTSFPVWFWVRSYCK